jgi:hypothetical protein
VELHVKERSHINNQGYYLLKRIDNMIIAFDNLLIEETAWNGISEGSCVLCQVEIEDLNIHRLEPTHLLNLIQSKVEFDDPKKIYRSVSFYSPVGQVRVCNV